MRISERARENSASPSDSSDGESVVRKPIFKSKRPTNLRKRLRVADPEESTTTQPKNTKEGSPPPFKKRAADSNRGKINNETDLDNGTYKGVASYKSFVQKNPDAPVKKVGPLKAPANVRTITVTDYSPDVCKDYKQTGFCGFGDSCKFLHAREDYKQGWQLDREWENVTKGKKNLDGQVVSSRNKNADAEDSDDEALLDGIPFACVICKEDYKNPIITKCGHYFCEACALQRFRKTPACAICAAGTGGVFNGAKRLRKLLEKKRIREEARESKEAEEAEDS
ncbi:MAG: RNA-splicing factor [Gomphillus americanus]|uniref:Pre-mRNA-splicing factor CWC24 n=1 Tax=Gomphillus americanus TaxID=1940652 RepID=A0A8H3EDK4_9LECA|nr:MAG: RNA-splicing factor [Gomphillus americanus]